VKKNNVSGGVFLLTIASSFGWSNCLLVEHLLQHERAHRTRLIQRVIAGLLRSRYSESLKEVIKGVWGMPRLSEAKKDVISCDKLRGSANRN
jgi:hypothetical protein